MFNLKAGYVSSRLTVRILEFVNRHVRGEGDVTVAGSKRDRTGKAIAKVRFTDPKHPGSKGFVHLFMKGANIDALMKAPPLAVARAVTVIQGGAANGKIEASTLDPLQAEWDAVLKAEPALRKDAEEIFIYRGSRNRNTSSISVAFSETLSLNMTATKLPEFVKAGIISRDALKNAVVNRKGSKPQKALEFLAAQEAEGEKVKAALKAAAAKKEAEKAAKDAAAKKEVKAA